MTAEMLLYMSARAQLVAEQIKPALEAGKSVLCDRFLLGECGLQGYGGGLAPETIWQVGNVATAGLVPDITFLFDVDLNTALERVGTNQDRLEKPMAASSLEDYGTGISRKSRDYLTIQSSMRPHQLTMCNSR